MAVKASERGSLRTRPGGPLCRRIETVTHDTEEALRE